MAKDIREEAAALREEASRARRWAREYSLYFDRERLLQHAKELEARAAELDSRFDKN